MKKSNQRVWNFYELHEFYFSSMVYQIITNSFFMKWNSNDESWRDDLYARPNKLWEFWSAFSTVRQERSPVGEQRL